ncbi:MAG TPA: DUF2059 domain-containing protein [Opitutaceae bacterium]|jgi:hypothetical protein|nr:DUF2059 domain-containing protein [Opitutaceae bacterium]
MKLPALCLALLLTASAPAAPAATGNPILHGLIASGDSVRFLLTTPGEGSGKWYSIGESVGDWKLASYRDRDGVLVLHRADGTGADVELSLVHAHAAAVDNQATLAQAQALLQKINFTQMMQKVMAQQKQAMANMSRQALMQRELSGPALDKALAQQSKMMDAVWNAMGDSSMQDAMAQVYSEVYTPSELSGISDFYSTPAGQAMLDKAPEIQQKTMQVIMPKLMQAMQAAQKAARAQAQAEAQQAQAPAQSEAPVSPAPQP